MATLSLSVDGSLASAEPLARPARDRIRQAREHRRQNYEPTWHQSAAFAAGNQWHVWHTNSRTLRRIQDVDPRYRGRELFTADRTSEYRTTILGELAADTDPPQLLLVRDDAFSEGYQGELNKAVQYAWDVETDAAAVLAEVDQYTVDLGTAAVRCRFDATVGEVKGEVPYMDGKPLLDPQQAMGMMGGGPTDQVQMGPIRAGKISLEALSPFNTLVPPGIANDRLFPWEAIITATPLDKVIQQYGDVAAGLSEDKDIQSTIGTETKGASLSPAVYASSTGLEQRLRDHVWLVTYYQRPTQDWPDGLTLTFAGNEYRLIDVQPRLPYQSPEGDPRSGITYFRWWPVTGRFYGRSLIEAMKDGQRTLNKRRTQHNEIIDRGMPFVIVEEGSGANRKQGSPLELVYLKKDERAPVINGGIGPGPWMAADMEALDNDIEHATGVRAVRFGENPENVKTYAQLAQMNENEQVKRSGIHAARRRGHIAIVEDIVYDMRTWWGPQKPVMLAGDEDQAEATLFNATKIPPFFIVRAAAGSSRPRSEAAELQKITEVWNGAVASGAVLQNPAGWIQWYKESLDAGEALDLPTPPPDAQHEKALLENHLLLNGDQPPVAYYDPIGVHVPQHRIAQDEALMAQDIAAYERIETHVQQHLKQAAQNLAEVHSLGPTGASAAVPPGPDTPPPMQEPAPPDQQSTGQPTTPS